MAGDAAARASHRAAYQHMQTRPQELRQLNPSMQRNGSAPRGALGNLVGSWDSPIIDVTLQAVRSSSVPRRGIYLRDARWRKLQRPAHLAGLSLTPPSRQPSQDAAAVRFVAPLYMAMLVPAM